MRPTFGSAFAGIGGFELGLERAGWECRWQIENDKKCSEILERHWPDVKRYGDIEEVNPKELEAVDLLCGGFPCQDLSVAGKRGGLSGERSGLFWELVRLARELQPRWLLIENVPGFLSSNEGEDFALAIKTLAECGYGLAWRVLDSQYFGVPQRRRRVFIVGYLGAMCPPEILFESEGSEGDIAEGGKAGEDIAYCLRERPSHSGDKGDGGVNTTLITTGALQSRDYKGIGSTIDDKIIIEENTRDELRIRQSPPTVSKPGGKQKPWIVQAHGSKDPNIAPTLRSPDPNAPRGPDGKRRDGGPGEKIPIIAQALAGRDGRGHKQGDPLIWHDSRPSDRDIRRYGDKSPTVSQRWGTGGCNVPYVGEEADPNGVREASGVPRRVDYPDSPRYRALGNAVTVQVAEWIGRRILGVL